MKKYPRGPMVRVYVKKEHVSGAVAANSSKCWIAEAIRDVLPHATQVRVDLATARFTDPEKNLRYVYLTPYSAQKALLLFDEGTIPAPFSFLLRDAHVTRAGTAPGLQAKRAAAKAANPKSDKLDHALRKARLASGTLGHGAVRRVGGRRPPQLRMMRQFGIRAFRGASKQRLEADAAAVARADTSGGHNV